MAEWPYRSSLDCIVEAPDGRFAGYCLMWPDDENRVGELEPVGAREEFRRLGVGAAVCTFALRACTRKADDRRSSTVSRSLARALYESIGFRIHATIVGYCR